METRNLKAGDKFISHPNTVKYDSFLYEVIRVLNNSYYVKELDNPWDNSTYTWINKGEDITQV